MTTPPHTFATIYILPQIQENVGELDITVLYGAAPHGRPTVHACITPRQNQHHATRGPAWATCLLNLHITITSPICQHLQVSGTQRNSSERRAPPGEIRPQIGREQNAWASSLASWGHAPPCPIPSTLRQQGHSEANGLQKRHERKQLVGWNAPGRVHHPPPRSQQCPSPIKTKPPEDKMTKIEIEISPASSRYRHQEATHPDPHYTHKPLEPPLTRTQPPNNHIQHLHTT